MVRETGIGWGRACRSGVVVLLVGAAVFAGEPAPSSRTAPVMSLAWSAGGPATASGAEQRAAELLSLRAEEVVRQPRAIGPGRTLGPATSAPGPTDVGADRPGEQFSAVPPPSTPPGGAAAPAAAAGLPLEVDVGSSGQVVTVVAPSSRSTTAELTAWQRGPAGWSIALGPVPARIGSGGVGAAGETSTRTPAGAFGMTEAFGRAPDPGTRLPYRVVDGDDWWVSDVTSARYNQYAQCTPGACDFDETAAENLSAVGPVYDRAVVIDYNRGGIPGAGSAFFLHVSNGAPTAGCVAIDGGSLAALLRWLDPAASPRIAIGVG